MKKSLGWTPLPKGPCDAIWERLIGQFWIRVALLSTDLPEGPKKVKQ